MLYSRDGAFVSFLQLRLNVLCSETDLIQILSDSPESRKKNPKPLCGMCKLVFNTGARAQQVGHSKAHRDLYNVTLVHSASPQSH